MDYEKADKENDEVTCVRRGESEKSEHDWTRLKE